MIYGNKFYGYGINESAISFDEVINLMETDIINFNTFLENSYFNIDSFILTESQETAISKIIQKILDLLRKVGVFVQKFINNAKQKLFVIGKGLINALDDMIAGKYSASDDKLISAATDRLFLSIDDSIKSNLNEAPTSDKFDIYMFAVNSVKTPLEGNYAEELLSFSLDFLNSYDQNRNYSANNEDELNKLHDEYKKREYSSTVHDNLKRPAIADYIKRLTEDQRTLNLDIQDIKNYVKNDKFPSDAGKTRNEHISYHKFTLDEKSNLADYRKTLTRIRDLIRYDMDITEGFIKEATKTRNVSLDRMRKAKQLYDRMDIVAKNGHWDNSLLSTDSAVFGSISDTLRVCTEEYRLLGDYINAFIYCTKNDYKIVIKLIRKWGKNVSQTS